MMMMKKVGCYCAESLVADGWFPLCSVLECWIMFVSADVTARGYDVAMTSSCATTTITTTTFYDLQLDALVTYASLCSRGGLGEKQVAIHDNDIL